MFAERDLPREAISYAEHAHAGQLRADGTAFITHPLEVVSLLDDTGASDHLIAAGALHDVIEKTSVTASDLLAGFGPGITALVLFVTDDVRIRGYEARKAALRQQLAGAGDEALELFAADKVSNVRALRREMAREPLQLVGGSREPPARRLRHYQRSLALLTERLGGSHLVHELRAELARVHRERPLALRAS